MSDLLTVPEVAKTLRVDVSTVGRWIRSGLLQSITLPYYGKRKVYRIKRESLEQMLRTSHG
jgi:excisionase family DNA binding protein